MKTPTLAKGTILEVCGQGSSGVSSCGGLVDHLPLHSGPFARGARLIVHIVGSHFDLRRLSITRVRHAV